MVAAAVLAATLHEPPLPDGNVLVRSLLQRQRQDEDALDEYAYDLTRVREELKDDGTVRKRRSRQFEVFHVRGRPVRQLVAEDGRLLSAERQAREQRRVRELVEAIRAGKVVVEEPHRRLSRLLEDFDFRSAGREVLGGREAVRIEFAPRAGDDVDGPRRGPDSGDDQDQLRRLSGRLWADEAEGRIVKVEVRSNTHMRVGLGRSATINALAFTAEFRKLDDAVWLPFRVETWASGRVLLVKTFRIRHVDEYSNYRRFSIDSEEHVQPPPG